MPKFLKYPWAWVLIAFLILMGREEYAYLTGDTSHLFAFYLFPGLVFIVVVFIGCARIANGTFKWFRSQTTRPPSAQSAPAQPHPSIPTPETRYSGRP